MPTPQSLFLLSPLPLSQPSPNYFPLKTTPLLKSPLPTSATSKRFPILSCSSSPKSTQDMQEDEILRFVANATDKKTASLPCVRTFQNDLSRLTLLGSVSFNQALTAAAADGGRTASQHIRSGIPAMVVETVFPGPSDDHATVSTRLFLPAEKVREKARKLRARLTEDILAGTTSENILASTFRQVVLQQLWNFELVLFRPGAVRDMEDLQNPREVPMSFLLRSSDERVISVLSEVICKAALQDTKSHFLNDVSGKPAGRFFRWFQRNEKISSQDSSVVVDRLLEDEVLENARSLLESFHSTREGFQGMRIRRKYNWWVPVGLSKLEKIGGHEFGAWISEYVPAYRLQMDTNEFKDVTVEGWLKSAENRWEVLLTHSQMVGMAETLDMYYEDTYSLPNKELPCNVACVNMPRMKRGSFMNVLSAALRSAIFLVGISVLSLFYFPHVREGHICSRVLRFLPTSQTDYSVDDPLNATKLIMKKTNDAFVELTRTVMERRYGAWIVEVAHFLKMRSRSDFGSKRNSDTSSSPSNINEN